MSGSDVGAGGGAGAGALDLPRSLNC